jgi:glycosyltransferase involved in cell wall biosynthesis
MGHVTEFERADHVPPDNRAPTAEAPPHTSRSAIQLRKQVASLEEQIRILQERSAKAEAQLAKIEASVSWRATRPIRRLSARWPRVSHLIVKKLRLLWWTATLWLPSRWRNWRTVHILQLERAGRVALIIDYRWPRPDQDSGSVDAMNLISALREVGFTIVFAADTEFGAETPYRDKLEAEGVLCISTRNAISIGDFLEKQGRFVDLCILSRVHSGGEFFERVRAACGTARVVFNTVDLHFLREVRHAKLENDSERFSRAMQTRAREIMLVQRCDATIVVSTTERELLARLAPEARILILPLARRLSPPRAGFEARNEIGFIGGFEHAPNVDAVYWFLNEIWPLVRLALPDCTFSIVGNGLPERLHAQLGPGVRYLGHVPDIDPWFESLRMTVAPLRFGAGAKGKVASSLAAGVPCVATPIAVEGMGLEHDREVMLAATPEAFAARIQEVYTDAVTWARLSRAAFACAERALDQTAIRRSVHGMLGQIGFAIPPPAAHARG